MGIVDMVILILKLIVAVLQLLDAVLKYVRKVRFKSHLRGAGNRPSLITRECYVASVNCACYA